MAKYDEREGNSCHIHLSLRGDDGEVVFWDDDGRDRRSTTSSSPGILATMPDFTLLYAPNVNSYKRFAAGSFAPTTIAWGLDNRTCAVRLVGHGTERPDGEPRARRRREPLPRARRDAGRRPLRHRARARRSRPSWSATPTPPTRRTCPTPCARPATSSTASAIARAAFGDDVVDHYTNMADVELASFDAAVTDWELARGFERM